MINAAVRALPNQTFNFELVNQSLERPYRDKILLLKVHTLQRALVRLQFECDESRHLQKVQLLIFYTLLFVVGKHFIWFLINLLQLRHTVL